MNPNVSQPTQPRKQPTPFENAVMNARKMAEMCDQIRESQSDADKHKDPLDDIRPMPSHGLVPRPRLKFLYTGAEGLPRLVELLHSQLVTKSPVFRNKVSESAFAYYSAVLTWKRMLDVYRANGFQVTYHENVFLDQVDCLNLKSPKALQIYLNSIGNCKVLQGCEYRFRIFDHKYMAIGDYKGLFGIADHTTQHLYRAYPCLDIFGMRIQADLRDEADKMWKLPCGAADQKSVHPTTNLLGWKPAMQLGKGRRDFLNQVGVTGNSFRSHNETLLFNLELVTAIQNVLDYPEMMQLNEVSKKLDGSLGQIPYLECVGTEESELANAVTQFSYAEISPSISQLAAALSFRIVRYPGRVQNGSIQVNWCINKFADDKVPASYNEHCNDLRAAESAVLQLAEFEAEDTGFVAGLSRWIESTLPLKTD